MDSLPSEIVQAYRAHTFRTAPGLRITSKEEAIAYVNERGFIYFWPIKGIALPSLWTAVAGDRPVADAHDDPGHVSWGWKDSLLGQRVWYYAKVLRQKATIISLDTAPSFYALSENFGSPEEDYLELYRHGRLTQESKAVYEALLDKGPLDAVSLRRAARLSSNEAESRFNRALSDLQSHFLILPTGVTDAGAWHYAFAYDVVARHFPELVEKARFIGEAQARQRLLQTLLCSLGALQLRDLTRLFGWSAEQARQAVESQLKSGALRGPFTMETTTGEWYATPGLFAG